MTDYTVLQFNSRGRQERKSRMLNTDINAVRAALLRRKVNKETSWDIYKDTSHGAVFCGTLRAYGLWMVGDDESKDRFISENGRVKR